MSASPFFQSAGRGDLLFVVEPIRTKRSKLAGKDKHDSRLGCFVQVKKRGG